MNVIAKRTLRFSLAVLILDLALEAVTIELPFSRDNLDVWKQKLVLHAVMVAVVSICALAGGSIGFYHFPKERNLEVRQIVWIGGSFVAVAFVVDNLLAAGGLIVLFLGLTVLALLRSSLLADGSPNATPNNRFERSRGMGLDVGVQTYILTL